MSSYSVAEARNTLPNLIDRAQQGESVIITRHGKPVAELRRIPTARTLEDRRAFMAEFAKRPKLKLPEGMTIMDLLHGRDDERR